MKRLAIVTTHPIQYNAPWFKLLARREGVDLKIFYTWSQAKEKVKDKSFGREIAWDIPLLKGYNYEFVENVSKNPGTNYWTGIDNPELPLKLEEFEPDAILVYGWNMKSHFKVLRHFKGKIPVWFRGDSTLLSEQNYIKKFVRRIWLTYVYSHVDKAFFVGTENKKYFMAHGLKESQLIFAPHAIDNSRFEDSNDRMYEKKAREWQKKLGFEKDDDILLYAGKFEEIKNLLFLIQTVQDINGNARVKKLKLLLVGNGPLEHQLKKRVGKDENICFLPFQNQSVMPIVYRLGNIFCLPSQSETWGLAVNEAMACSRPVIVSNKVGCAIDVVEAGENGFIFKLENFKDFKLVISQMASLDTHQMGKNAEKTISKWNFQEIVEKISTQLINSDE